MSKWKCVICQRQVVTETKPSLVERLCADCKVSHWRKVVDIYSFSADAKDRLAEAKSKLRAAEKARNKTRQEVIQ